jgi:hypothetical protein
MTVAFDFRHQPRRHKAQCPLASGGKAVASLSGDSQLRPAQVRLASAFVFREEQDATPPQFYTPRSAMPLSRLGRPHFTTLILVGHSAL